MTAWKKAILLGLLSWLVPFVVGFAVFSLRQPNRPLFESIMAVTVTATAVILGLSYMRSVERETPREGLLLGLVWFAINVLVDAPLMLFGGPMQMSFAQYMADIGLTYASIPVVTWGLATARSRLPAKP